MRNIFQLSTVLFGLISMNLLAQGSIEELKKSVAETENEREKLFNELAVKTVALENRAEKLEKISANLPIDGSLGRIQRLEVMAQRYAAEVKARQELTVKVNKLAELVRTIQQQDKKLLGQRQLLMLLAKQHDEAARKKADESEHHSMSGETDITKVQFYEVKKAATLKEISASSDVYNDHAQWEMLYDSNKDLLKDPNGIVPAGTKLIVPYINNKDNFKSL